MYGVSINAPFNAPLPEARTATTITMVIVGLWILVELIQPLTRERIVLVAALAAAFALTILVPLAREFFALVIPSAEVLAVIFGVTAVAVLLVHWSLIVTDRVWHMDLERRARAGAASDEARGG